MASGTAFDVSYWSFQVWLAIKCIVEGGIAPQAGIVVAPEELRLRAKGAIFFFFFFFFLHLHAPVRHCVWGGRLQCLLQLVIFHPGVIMTYNLPFYCAPAYCDRLLSRSS